MKSNSLRCQDALDHARSLPSAAWILMAGLLLWGSRNAFCQSNAELLRMVQKGYQANLEKLRTWQGKAQVRLLAENWGQCDKIAIDSDVDFVFDADRKAVRWNYRQTSKARHEGGEAVELPRIFSNKMTRDGKVFLMGPYDAPREEGQNHYLTIDSADSYKVENTAYDFHPLLYFTHPTGLGSSLLDTLQFYSEVLQTPDPKHKVIREGSRVTLQVTNEELEIVNRYTFDLSQGCNLVEYYGSDPRITDTWTIEYTQVNGVFVPVKHAHANEDKTKDPLKRTVREAYFVTNVVNEPVPEEAFALEKLGVRAKDVINDKIVGVRYSYKNPRITTGLLWDLKIAGPLAANLVGSLQAEADVNLPRADDNDEQGHAVSADAGPARTPQPLSSVLPGLLASILIAVAGGATWLAVSRRLQKRD